MKVVIAHLYYDLLNLYGESGNVKALKKYLEMQGVKVEVQKVTIHEKLHFDDYDFIYIGAGTENNQKIALHHLLDYKDEVHKYIKNGKPLLATGNSIELFGKYILDNQKNKYKALSIFNYYAEELPKRIVCESICETKILKEQVIGFQNRCSVLKKDSHNLFMVKYGYGSDLETKKEGIHFNNFFGTYLIGPLLVRNPELLRYFGDMLILNKEPKYFLEDVDLSLENEAYNRNLVRYQEKMMK